MNKITFIILLLISQLGFAQEKSKAKTLRILCYNIHHANPPSKPDFIDIDAIVRVIKESNADVVALQEVDKNTLRSGSLDEARLIAEKTGLYYQFFKAIDHDGGDYGLAILSRSPIKKAKLVPLPQQILAEKRILAYATIAFGGQKFILANTHLDATKTPENRIMQMQHILKELQNIKLPIFLCGDLNSVADSETIKLLDTQFKRTCIENCPGTTPVISPRRTIDYIATKNSNFTLLEYKVLDETYASDHRAITATFKLK